jgi:dienelactone hydrolase
MTYEATLSGYEKLAFTAGKWTRDVYRKGSGPAVIVIHEMPGLTPDVIGFADRVAAAGMTVYCPSLFGEPGRPISRGYVTRTMLGAICIRREFHVWATDRSSPIVDWLRALARKAHADCGGRGVGAVGMCFTGGFALAMMTEPAVVAPVLSQPSLPLYAGSRKRAAAIDASPAEKACARRRFAEEGVSMIGLRFHGDPFVPAERFQSLKAELGDAFEAIELDPRDARPHPALPEPHSVLTLNLADTGPTAAAAARVLAFFRERTGA